MKLCLQNTKTISDCQYGAMHNLWTQDTIFIFLGLRFADIDSVEPLHGTIGGQGAWSHGSWSTIHCTIFSETRSTQAG